MSFLRSALRCMPAAFFALSSLTASAGTLPLPASYTPTGFMSAQHTVSSGLSNATTVAVDVNGNVYVNEVGQNRVRKITQANGVTTATTVASYVSPVTVNGIAVDDAGNVYLNEGSTVVKETPSGPSTYTETTVVTGLISSRALAVSRDGLTLYVGAIRPTSYSSQSVWVYTLTSGTYVVNNTPAATNFINISAVAVDAAGNVYIGDVNNHTIKEAVYTSGSYAVQTVDANAYSIYGLSVDSLGTLYAGLNDSTSSQSYVVKYSGNTNPRTQLAVSTGLPSTNLAVAAMPGMHPQVFAATGTDGRLIQYGIEGGDFGTMLVGSTSGTYAVNFAFHNATSLNATHAVSITGTTIGSFVTSDFAAAGDGITCAGNYSQYATCTVDVVFTGKRPGTRSGAVVLYDTSGYGVYVAPLTSLATGAQATFDYTSANLSNTGDPSITFGALASDESGELFATIKSQGSIVRANVNSSGGPTTIATGVVSPTGLAVDGSGSVFYIDNHVLRYAVPSIPGTLYTVTTVGSTPANLMGIAVDGYGNLYLTSQSDGLVYKGRYVSSGVYTFSTIATVSGAGAVAVGPNGDVFVAQSSAIARLTPNTDGSYTVSTALDLTGGGLLGGSSPVALAVDNSNSLYYSLGVAEGVKVAVNSGSTWTQMGVVGISTSITGVTVTNSGVVYAASDNHDVYQYDPTFAPAVNFAATAVGHTSSDSPQRVTLHNSGNSALVLSVPGSGTNPLINGPDFTLSAGTSQNPCTILSTSSGAPFRLAAGNTCDVTVSYVPTVTGLTQESLIFTDNSLNATSPAAMQLVALNGVGLVAATKLQFASVPTSTVVAGGHVSNITVQEANNSGTVITTATDSITLTITDSGSNVVYSASQAAVNGVTTFDLSGAGLTRAGTTTITATASSITSAMATTAVTAGAVNSLTVSVNSTPQTATVSQAFTNVLAVTALDLYSNVVPGATVTFSAPASGASAVLSPASAATSSNGIASTGATANATAGSYTVTATSNGKTASFALTNIASVTISVTPATLPVPTVGIAYSQSLSASGGTAPYVYSVASGTLPKGMTLSPTGVLSGVPSLAGPFSFSVSATDANNVSGSTAYAVTAGKGTATVVLGSLTATYDGSGHFATATTTPAGLTVTFSYNNGLVTTPTPVGSYSVTATVTDANYTGSASGTLVISPASATVTLGSLAATYDGNTHAATAVTVPSGLPVNITYNGSATAPTAAGSYPVSAVVTDKNYSGSATGTLVIAAAAPAITFAIADHTFGDAAFAVNATSNSGGAITYSVVSGPATISSATLTITGAGAVTVRASQAAATNYAAATKDAVFNVAKATPALAFTISDHTYGDAAFGVSATSASTGAITYTVVGGPATVSVSTVTITGTGTVTVRATQAADSNYAAATKDAVFNVAKATPTITFTPAANTTYGAAAVTLSASANSTGAVTYSVVSGPGSLTGASLSFTGAGSVVVRASVAADSNYSAGQSDRTITVAKANPTLNWATPAAVVAGTALSSTQLNATATGVGGGALAGNFVYAPAAGTVLTTTTTLAVTFTPTDTANYNSAQLTTNIGVVSASSTTTVGSSLNPAPLGVGVPFTVSVASSGTVPTGTVAVTEGGSLLTTLTLTNGSATWTPTTLTAGAHALTFTYSGSATVTASSASYTETTTAYAIETQSGNNQNVTVTANSGDAANLSLSIAGGAGFSGVVTFSCTNLPANATCTFTPPSVTLTNGGAAQTVTLSISTQTQASLSAPHFFESKDDGIRLASILGLPSLLLAGLGWRARRLRGGGYALLMLLCAVSLAGVGALTGCGSSSDSSTTVTTKKVTAGTYNVNVVGTNGSTTVTMPVTFTVK